MLQFKVDSKALPATHYFGQFEHLLRLFGRLSVELLERFVKGICCPRPVDVGSLVIHRSGRALTSKVTGDLGPARSAAHGASVLTARLGHIVKHPKIRSIGGSVTLVTPLRKTQQTIVCGDFGVAS